MYRALGSQARRISSAAPTLYFPTAKPQATQVAVNTAKALDMIRAQLGPKPAPYVRRHTASFPEIKSEIEMILSSCGSSEAPLEDGKELTQMQVIERVLRHGLCTYLKNEGQCSYEDMEKWLVYTASDSMEFTKLKRENELAEKYEAFKAGKEGTSIPEFNWAAEYEAVIDREIVDEKRRRYDEIAVTTFERDEAAISAELKGYKQPVQDALLDQLVDQIHMFKPFLAKQVIQAKLIERNMEGQVTFSRFADWNPDARDLAELYAELKLEKPGSTEEAMPVFEEAAKRYADVRMKTKEEVLEVMTANQQAQASAKGSAGGGADDTRRQQLLAEIARLQSRASGSAEKEGSDDKMSKEEKEAAAEAAREAHEKQMQRFRVGENVVKEKGLLGLSFLDASKQAASA